jgi:hypothetical protein
MVFSSKETVQMLISGVSKIYSLTPVDARSALIGMFCAPVLYNGGNLIYNGGNFLLQSNTTTRIGYLGSTICLYLLGPRVALYVTPYVAPALKVAGPVIGKALIFVGNKLVIPVV